MILELGPRLKAVLDHLSEPDLARLGKNFHLSGKERDRDTLYQRLTDPQHLHDLFARLSAQTRETLAGWLLFGAVVSPDHLHLLPHFWQAEKELEATGLMYLLRSGYYRQVYAIPAEFCAPLWEWLDIGAAAGELTADHRSERTETVLGPWFPFLHDVFQMVSFARTDPILLTQQMTVYRRIENKLLTRLWPMNKDAARGRVVHCLQFAQAQRMLRFDHITRTLEVDEETAQRYWNGTDPERFADWIRFGCEVQGPTAQRQILLALASRIEPDQWLDYEALSRWLADRHIAFSNRGAERSLMLDRLIQLGIWEDDRVRGRLSDHAYAAYREQYLATREGQSIVEPTGDVLVPLETPYAQRWIWDILTTPVRSDRMTLLRIEPAAVEKALDHGIAAADDYLGRVKPLVKTPLPDNLAANVRDWYRQLTRHRWVEATLLHSANESDSQMAEASLGDFVIGRLSPLDLIVPGDQVGRATAHLRRQGMLLRDKIERPGEQRSQDQEPFGDPFDLSALLGFTSVTLPQAIPGLATKSPKEMERILMEAIHHQRQVVVQYYPYGTEQPIVEAIQPASLNRGWVQGWRVSNRQIVSMSLHQITAIGE